MKKRITALLMAGVLGLSMAGCGSSDAADSVSGINSKTDAGTETEAGNSKAENSKEDGTAGSIAAADEKSSVWEPIPDDEAAAQIDGSGTEKDKGQSNASGEAESKDEDALTKDGEGQSEADEAETASAEETQNTAATYADSDISLGGTCEQELKNIVAEFISANGLNTGNFSVSFMDLTTGETCYYNELKQFDAASTYKFPLNLLYYDMQAEGKISGDSIVPGTNTTLTECHHQSLEFSNNELSEAMMDNLGSYDVVKRNMRKYFTLSDAEIDSSYYNHNYYCSRMMMDCSKYLYDHQSEYSEALGYLKAAQPGQYFKKYITDCSIAQKYGQRDGYEHTAGIVFADKPFVLSIYTYKAGGADLIGRLAEVFYEYTQA